jgi:tetratricopeptide (TPR) repeat protein
MEGRKALILTGGILCGLMGCSHTEQRQSADPLVSSAPPAKPPAVAGNTPVNIRKDPEPAKELQAKPATCVTMGDVFAQCAADENRTPQDRNQFSMKAQDSYRRALQMDAKFAPAYVGLAKAQEFAGDRDGALKTWQTALTKLPNEPSLWFERGLCLGRMQRFDEATMSLGQACRLEPRNKDYCKSVGFMLARQGRDEEALTWLRKVMPEADAQYNTARMMQHIGQGEAARQHLVLALQSQPNHVPSQKMLMEGKEPPAETQAVQQAQYNSAGLESNNVHAVYQPTPSVAVPVRPADFSMPAAAAPAPAPATRSLPVMPVTIDQFDSRLSMTTLNSAAGSKPEAKSPTVPAVPKHNPPDITYTIEPEP